MPMIAYFDCQSGASGDMILGALVDAGLPLAQLQQSIDQLDIGARLRAEHVMRCGVSATRISVEIADQEVTPAKEHHLAAEIISRSSHDHHHHGHTHEHGGHKHGERAQAEHDHHHAGHAHTRVTALVEQIEDSSLDTQIKHDAVRIYRRLAEAEASVHGADVETVVLHEVGSADALVDIVGAIAGLGALGVDRVFCSALHCGSGIVRCAHGQYPIPAPGVVALCHDVPLVQTDVAAELLTPTGAAILTTLTEGYGSDCPPMKLQAAGYGAGGRDLPVRPNVLRVRLGEFDEKPAVENCVLVEANLDDMNPEVFSFLFDRLLESGARDVFVTAILMKKGRPGHLLSVLTDPSDVDQIAQIVLSETTSLGLRSHEVARQALPRRWDSVSTPYGDVRVKVTSVGGRTRGAPEYEDCARLAKAHRIPILTVYSAATAAHVADETTL